MPDNTSTLARDEVRLRQIQSMRTMGRLLPRGFDAQALLYTSVRDSFPRSAKLLLDMGVPPAYVGWTQQQADRYLAGDLEVASQMVEPSQVTSIRVAAEASLLRPPRRNVRWEDLMPGKRDDGSAPVREAQRGPTLG